MKGPGGKKPLGCLSVNAIIATVAVVVVVSGVGMLRGGVLFSPGGLNAKAGSLVLGGVRSHAEISSCSTCHTTPFSGRVMADNCLACHTDLDQDPKNFHRIMLAEGKIQGCQECHTDHRGPDGSLTVFDLQKFPHTQIGYALLAHQKNADSSPFKCSDCHTGGYTGFDQAVCANCHFTLKAAFLETHAAAYGLNCLGCHDGVDSYGHAFDHIKVAFALTGKHLTVQCAGCHSGEQTIAAMQATSQLCVTCHAKGDVHNGDLGQDCGACHIPSDWAQATVDHSKMAFPLVGKHQTVVCQNCHIKGVFKGTPKDCASCHAKDDVHNGDLGQDCGACHTPSDWTQATVDHNKTTFPLVGRHQTAPCASCHINNVFKETPKDCTSCHSKDDAHSGQLGTDCGACHTPAGWLPASFDHSKSAFPLVGKHQTVPCASCHVNNVFKGTPVDCYSCHAKDDAHKAQFGKDCSLCHTPASWLPATFDHAKSAFPLTGAHLKVNCNQCHVNGVFKSLSTACVSCHAEPAYHQGLFGTACESCHTTSAWAPARFTGPHTFPISHGGANTCQKCHPSNLNSYTCFTCHPQAQLGEGHQGVANLADCVRCHPTGGGGG